MEKSVIIGKRIECIIGLIILIPVLIGVISFIISIFNGWSHFYTLENLSDTWSYSLHGFGGSRFDALYDDNSTSSAGAMSSAPIYLGLMAIAGVWLIKDSFKYFFMKLK